MPGLDYNRFRNKTISFRVSPEEGRLIKARYKVSGTPKAEFIRRSILESQINIMAGRYQSDRLSLEIKKLREECSRILSDDSDEIEKLLLEIRALLKEIQCVIDAK